MGIGSCFQKKYPQMAFFVAICITIGYIAIKDKGWPRGPPEKPKKMEAENGL